jgi:hypothetical protein
MGLKLNYELEKDKEDQIVFSNCIQAFKVDFYQGINEKNKF